MAPAESRSAEAASASGFSRVSVIGSMASIGRTRAGLTLDKTPLWPAVPPSDNLAPAVRKDDGVKEATGAVRQTKARNLVIFLTSEKVRKST